MWFIWRQLLLKARMRRVGFFPTRTRTRIFFSQPDPILTRLNPNWPEHKKMKKIFCFTLKWRILMKKKKVSSFFFICNQNTFYFCWLKWVFCHFKLSINLFFLGSNEGPFFFGESYFTQTLLSRKTTLFFSSCSEKEKYLLTRRISIMII